MRNLTLAKLVALSAYSLSREEIILILTIIVTVFQLILEYYKVRNEK